MDISVPDLIVERSTSLKETMSTIDSSGHGVAFVVDETDSFVGTATDGDIRRGILDGRRLSEPVETVMNDDPIVIRDDWSDGQIRQEVDRDRLQRRIPTGGSILVPVLDDGGRIADTAVLNENGEQIESTADTSDAVETVLVIGGAGYIGSILSRKLLDQGFEVKVLDNLLYGDHSVRALRENPSFTLLEKDMRSIENVVDAIEGVDAVVHLAALVGDPASSIDSQKTLELNYHSVKMIAGICKYHQVNRFIFASTCSVYGEAETPETLLTEESPLNPVSLYAKSKIESEKALLEMEDENFAPTIFRMATIYGLSPRMRFDLVVNIVTAKAYEEGTIPIFGGEQYRPNVHVADAAQAYVDCLNTPIDDVSGEVFNIGSNEQNYQIKEIGELLDEEFPSAEIDRQRDKEDDRSYQVDFSKATEVLGFEPEWTIRSGAREIWDALEAGDFEDYTDSRYSNIKTLENQYEVADL
jgi:nucleoside-diphosphate-sugar epimerase